MVCFVGELPLRLLVFVTALSTVPALRSCWYTGRRKGTTLPQAVQPPAPAPSCPVASASAHPLHTHLQGYLLPHSTARLSQVPP